MKNMHGIRSGVYLCVPLAQELEHSSTKSMT